MTDTQSLQNILISKVIRQIEDKKLDLLKLKIAEHFKSIKTDLPMPLEQIIKKLVFLRFDPYDNSESYFLKNSDSIMVRLITFYRADVAPSTFLSTKIEILFHYS